MCPIRRNSLLVHVAYPKYLANGLVVVVVERGRGREGVKDSLGSFEKYLKAYLPIQIQ